MSDLKKMYHTMQADPFPQEMRILLGDQELKFSKRTWDIQGESKGLRYGENPDQPAALYELKQGQLELGGVGFRSSSQGLVSSLTEEHILQSGKHPGKINLTDVDNGLNILQYLSAKSAAVILKHNNPCGAAWSDQDPLNALQKAYQADRIAAFGGTVVLNFCVTQDIAEFVNNSYFEVLAAPCFEQDALQTLKKRPNLRILELPGISRLQDITLQPFLDIKSLVDSGLVVQFSYRNRILSQEDWLPAEAKHENQSYLARTPSKQEAEDLLFAWAVEAGVTSNSVIFARNGATVAIGTGEQDRVGCVELAIHKAYTKYADLLCFEQTGLSLYQLKEKAITDSDALSTLKDIEDKTAELYGGLPGCVLVSDGFFPFRDGVDLVIEQGITAIAQPGGSMRDYEVIQACNQAEPQVAMVFTGQRSFKH
jgi:phosphoribosylaminoimidazolecarboxamide formyltransferase/IMP cyclohydrolase